ncbi:MOSC domain-containing protein [Streptomyces sp. NA04227]|uniref:MOSC domain-containing protein n=1 Tax=Streptomyces sp. NA04227 TaxID=2742136 RepID=UPI00159032DD|nr:MOSC domain-containing protein [Streptomyces sp. NA04227]QKW08656.1 MOSC domain-containing protein [Streptomyces sp. NA04227]
MKVLSVNVGRPTKVAYTSQAQGLTGIDKRPVTHPVMVSPPGPMRIGGSGLAGDAVCDRRYHGGNEQAVYAYAREDLDAWGRELGRTLDDGAFGENLTTVGIDVSHTLVGERWRVGEQLVLEATSGRVPCRTFAGWIGEEGWVRRFTQRALTGAYFRVIEPGEIRTGDTVEILHRPAHGISVDLQFRAVTTDRSLLPRLLEAGDALHPEAREKAQAYIAKYGAGTAG